MVHRKGGGRSLNADQIVRIAAASAAILFFAAPLALRAYSLIAERLKAFEAKEPLPFSTKVVLGMFLLHVAATGVPSVQNAAAPVATVEVQTPSPEMQQKVAAVKECLRSASDQDRYVWSDVWSKVAKVAAADGSSTEVLFPDTKSLRAFNIAALEIGWRRIGGNQPGKYPNLRASVEGVFADTLSLDTKVVTKDTRDRFVETAMAVAWAAR